MLLTNQSLSAVINKAYKAKMIEFNFSFIISKEKKIRTIIIKSYKFNWKILQNLFSKTAENVFFYN
jgi:hypothetical protein